MSGWRVVRLEKASSSFGMVPWLGSSSRSRSASPTEAFSFFKNGWGEQPEPDWAGRGLRSSALQRATASSSGLCLRFYLLTHAAGDPEAGGSVCSAERCPAEDTGALQRLRARQPASTGAMNKGAPGEEGEKRV